jgi:sulfur-oxidizing protein SoxY
MTRPATAIALAAMTALPQSALAGEAWDDIRAALYEGRTIIADDTLISLDVPYRSTNDPRTPLGADVTAPEGEAIKSVTLIIDENPMPVSAVFDLARPQNHFSFDTTMRMNGPSVVRVLMETEDGDIYMAESLVKTLGQGACAAPPGTDPVAALETLGTMDFALVEDDALPSVSSRLASLGGPETVEQDLRAEVSIMHPSHSGMQKDQITLLYLPARFVETVEVEADGAPLFKLTGSISLSENPSFDFDVPRGTGAVSVRLKDTDGAEFEDEFQLGQS